MGGHPRYQLPLASLPAVSHLLSAAHDYTPRVELHRADGACCRGTHGAGGGHCIEDCVCVLLMWVAAAEIRASNLLRCVAVGLSRFEWVPRERRSRDGPAQLQSPLFSA